MTRQEAAEYIGVRPQTLADWACSGRYDLPYYKAGGKKVFYRKTDLDKWLESNKRTRTE